MWGIQFFSWKSPPLTSYQMLCPSISQGTFGLLSSSLVGWIWWPTGILCFHLGIFLCPFKLLFLLRQGLQHRPFWTFCVRVTSILVSLWIHQRLHPFWSQVYLLSSRFKESLHACLARLNDNPQLSTMLTLCTPCNIYSPTTLWDWIISIPPSTYALLARLYASLALQWV